MRGRKSSDELLALAQAELAANRLPAARQHFRAAIELAPFHTAYADAAWGLSQAEYMDNNFETSLEWAQIAMDHGLTVLQWHLDYLKALAHVDVYRLSGGPRSDELKMKIGRPDVPRIEVRLKSRRRPSLPSSTRAPCFRSSRSVIRKREPFARAIISFAFRMA